MTTSFDRQAIEKLLAEADDWTKDVWPPNGTHLVDRLAEALRVMTSPETPPMSRK